MSGTRPVDTSPSATETKRTDKAPPVEKLDYETARDELIDVVRRLEQGGLTLDDSVALWERGEALVKRCEEHLDGAAKRVDAVLAEAQEDETQGPSPEEPAEEPDE